MPVRAARPPTPATPDWPCIQRKVPEISAGMMWAGPALEADDRAWREDEEVAALVAALSLRRLPLEEAQAMIDGWAAEIAGDRNRELTRLFTGLLRTINAERSEIMAGIERFARHQRALAEKVRALSAALDERRSREASSAAETAETQHLEEEFAWEVRIFEEREQSLTYVCESPVILEQRLFALARQIMTHLEDQ